MDSGAVFGIFAVVWVGLAAAAVFFHKRAPREVKVRWHPWIEFGLSVVFAAFGTYWLKDAGTGAVALIWGVCLAIATLNWRLVKFCPSCNATVRPLGFTSAKECPRCRAEL